MIGESTNRAGDKYRYIYILYFNVEESIRCDEKVRLSSSLQMWSWLSPSVGNCSGMPVGGSRSTVHGETLFESSRDGSRFDIFRSLVSSKGFWIQMMSCGDWISLCFACSRILSWIMCTT
jgi:hypothetical protein